MSTDDSRPAGSGPAPRDERESQGLCRTFVLTDADGTVTRYEHFVEEDRIRVLMMDGRIIEFRPERAPAEAPRDKPADRAEVGLVTYSYEPGLQLHSASELSHTTTFTYWYGEDGEVPKPEGGS